MNRETSHPSASTDRVSDVRKPIQARYGALFSELHLHILLVDATGRITYANPRAESALAAQPGRLKSVTLDSLLSLRNPQLLAHELRKSANEGHWAGEVVLSRLDGTEYWARVRACKCPKAFRIGDAVFLEFEDITGSVELMATLMRRNEELSQRNRELEIVSKVGRMLLADTDLEYRLTTMLKEAAMTVGVGCGCVFVKTRDGQRLMLRSAYGFTASLLVDNLTIGVDDCSLVALSVRTMRPQISEDMANEPNAIRGLVNKLRVMSAISVPMIANGDAIGGLFLAERGEHRSFSSEEVTLVEVVANAAASAVSNALLAEDVEVSRSYWQRTFDSISDMIVVVDASGKVLRANEAMASRLGASASDLLGEKCELLIPAIGEKMVKRVVSSGQAQEFGAITIAGEQCEVTAFPLSQASAKPDAVVIRAEIVKRGRRLRRAA